MSQDFQQKASKAAVYAENEASASWDWFSSIVRAHPKTGIALCLVVGVLLDHFVVSLVW